MSKRCFYITGPEGAGHRVLAALLIEGGCIGDASTNQRWSQTLPTTENPAVVIRSLPHGGEMPDIKTDLVNLSNRGYQTTLLIPVRGPVALCKAQVHGKHTDSEADARVRVQRAWQHLGPALASWCYHEVHFVPTYLLHVRPRILTDFLGLLLPFGFSGEVTVEGRLSPLHDPDAKYFHPEGSPE